MSLIYKIDVLAELKAKGYSTYRLRRDKLLGERVIQQLRVGDPVSWDVLSRLCDLLACDVGDILQAVHEPSASGSPVGEWRGGVASAGVVKE